MLIRALAILFILTAPATALCESPWIGPSTPQPLASDTYLPHAAQTWLSSTRPSPTTFYPITVQDTVNGNPVTLTYCAGHDYLRVGNATQIYLAPGMNTVETLLNQYSVIPPTRLMVEHIHQVAQQRFAPSPRTPGSSMTHLSEGYAHYQDINPPSDSRLRSGHKKDIVLHPRRGQRIAIFGWIRPDGTAIQPLSTFHGQGYGDYSHGYRPILRDAEMNGQPVDLLWLLNHPDYHTILSPEGPIRRL